MRKFKLSKKHIPYALLAAVCIVVAVLCVVKAIDAIKYNEDLTQSSVINPLNVILTADGGNGKDVPKNTVYAIDDIKIKGFTSVKIDARLTKDKKWVSLESESISDVTNGFGKVSDYSYYELLNYNLKNVPSSETAVIELVSDTVKYAYDNGIVPIIYIHNYDKTAIKSLMTSLAEITTHVPYIASGDIRVLEYAEKVSNEITAIYYVDEITDENISQCKKEKTYTLCFNAENKKNNSASIEKAMSEEIRLICYGTQTLKDIEDFYKLGIRQFINESVEIGDIQ